MRTSWLDKIRRGIARPIRARGITERRKVGALSLCFDDFPRNAWTEGGRVLREHGVRGTYFVAGGLCERTFAGQQMFGSEDLEAVHAEGHEIGCHTFEHESCLRLGGRELSRALMRNEVFVRERLGDVRMTSFTYPYGDAPLTAKLVASRRFSAARGVDPGLNRGAIDLSHLRAIGLERDARTVEQVEAWIEKAARTASWAIVFTHDVSDRPGPFGCRPEQLDRIIRTARAAGLEILTVKGALASRAFPSGPARADRQRAR